MDCLSIMITKEIWNLQNWTTFCPGGRSSERMQETAPLEDGAVLILRTQFDGYTFAIIGYRNIAFG